jgi:hypothetical protein
MMFLISITFEKECAADFALDLLMGKRLYVTRVK